MSSPLPNIIMLGDFHFPDINWSNPDSNCPDASPLISFFHLLDSYIGANQRFSTFLSMITKYNRVPLGFDPSVARLLGHDPTPRPICPVLFMIKRETY